MYHSLIKTAIQWLICVDEPLTPEELLELCLTDPTRAPYVQEKDREPMKDIFHILSPLIEIIFESSRYDVWTRTTVVLSHFSVKEYLTSDRAQNSCAPGLVIDDVLSPYNRAQCFLAYIIHVEEHWSSSVDYQTKDDAEWGSQDLSYLSKKLSEDYELLMRFPLLTRAIHTWPRFSRQAEEATLNASQHGPKPGLELNLLCDETMRQFWYRHRDFRFNASYETLSNPILTAHFLGLSRTAARICARSDARVREHAFVEASRCGFEAVIEVSLNAGVDINAEARGVTVLVAA